MKRRIFIGAAVLSSSLLHAQDTTKVLQQVIVTANKIEQKQEETGKVLTVISREELQKSAGLSLGEVLNRQVGITIGGANNTLGANQTIYLRGAASANTLILMDGVPLYDASGISSEFDLNSFTADHIERIEILKGAQSTLYGSDAVAGVINIITIKPGNKRYNFDASLSFGSYNTWRGAARLSGKISAKTDYHIAYTKVNSKGFSSAYDSAGNKNFEDDGFNQDAFSAGLGFTPLSNLSVKLYGKLNFNEGDIDGGAFIDDRDYTYTTRNLATGLNARYQVKKATLFFNYNHHYYTRQYRDDSSHIGGYSEEPFAYYSKYIREYYRGTSHFAELYTNVKFSKAVSLVGGVDYRTGSTSQDYYYLSSFGPYVPPAIGEDTAKTNQFSGYASLLYARDNFNLGVGGRANSHSVYGENFTWSINPSYRLDSNIKVFVNVASAYRVPSLYMLYSEFGNKQLDPESSVSYEAGAEFSGRNWMARAVAFRRDIKNVFVFFYNTSTFQSIYINEDRQEDKGLELEAAWSFAPKWKLTSNYTFITGEISTKDGNGKDTVISNLYRRPKNVLNAGLSYNPGKLQVSAGLRSVSSFLEPKFAAAPVRLEGYQLLDLYAEYRINNRFRVFGDVKNVLDEKYFDQEGFGTRRVNGSVGVAVRM